MRHQCIVRYPTAKVQVNTSSLGMRLPVTGIAGYSFGNLTLLTRDMTYGVREKHCAVFFPSFGRMSYCYFCIVSQWSDVFI
jgi:hypothetical protein